MTVSCSPRWAAARWACGVIRPRRDTTSSPAVVVLLGQDLAVIATAKMPGRELFMDTSRPGEIDLMQGAVVGT